MSQVEVLGNNQSPRYSGHNTFHSDGVLREITRTMPRLVRDGFITHGKWVGSAEAQDLARLANDMPPVLRTHTPNGDRADIVEFHPTYHALMRRSCAIRLNGSVWDDGDDEKGIRHEARAVRLMMTSGLEMGHTCPIVMTNAAVAVLLTTPEVAKEWLPKVLSSSYDSSQRPPTAKTALTIGMGMTERQGGSDVRANTSTALLGNDGKWRVNGEKWFFSAPMCDAFLILAQSPSGLSCFLIPRLLPDGQNNGLQFQRLKGKLGNHSNASSEVKFENTQATLVGEEGKGVKTILEMITLTRLDCAVGSAGQMRAALAEAVHHTRNRVAFGKKLFDQPLMQRVLADLALDVAAAQVLTLRLARSFDRASTNESEATYARLMTPVVKYWVCKSAAPMIVEAMECIGGNGYVEENFLPRLYREAPLNAIWEGSGNIMCLDVLRVLRKGPKAIDLVLGSLNQDLSVNGAEERSQTIDVLHMAADIALQDEGSARILTEQLALTAAAAELRRSMPKEIADAFIETRLGRPWRHTYGMMDSRHDSEAILNFVCH